MKNKIITSRNSKDTQNLDGDSGDEDAEKSISLSYQNYQTKPPSPPEKKLEKLAKYHNNQPIDPKKIRKPISAYFCFAQERKNQLRIEKPDFSISEIVKELGNEWKTLSDEEKEIYIIQANDDKERYLRELHACNQRVGN